MANQGGYPFDFSGYGASNPFSISSINQYSSALPVPQDLENAISLVTVDHLANLNLDHGQRFAIGMLLQARITGTLTNWYNNVYYPNDPSQDTPEGRRHALMMFRCFMLPNANPMNGQVDEHHRLTSQNPHYRAQSFLRRLILELGPQNEGLARAFVGGLGLAPPLPLPPPPAPITAFPHLPFISPLPFQPPSSLQVASPPTQPHRSYYCPGCGNHFKAFNNMNRHWFEEHFRSNRSSRELRAQYNSGALGPFTPEEAKAKQKDKNGVAESQTDRRSRRAKKKDAKMWRERMQTNPEGWEQVAQTEDGYLDPIPGTVNLQRKKRAQTKKRTEDKKDKNEEEEEE